MRLTHHCFLAVLLTAAAAAYAGLLSPPPLLVDDEVLVHLDRVAARVQISGDLVRLGVTDDAVRSDAVIELGRAGFKVVEPADAPSAATLIVSFSGVSTRDGRTAYNVHAELLERITLNRVNAKAVAGTWRSTGVIGVTTGRSEVPLLRQLALDQVKAFVSAHITGSEQGRKKAPVPMPDFGSDDPPAPPPHTPSTPAPAPAPALPLPRVPA